MSTSTQDGIQSPGEVAIEELILVANGKFIPLNDYLVELNIFESIFSSSISGDIFLSDSRNIIKFLPIIGEEYIIIKLQTPSLDSKIYKTFRITSVEDRTIVRDTNTQLYKLKLLQKEHKNTIYLQRKIDLFPLIKPNCENINVELDSRFINIKETNKHFNF
jgi:hypothetical protein